MTGVELCVMVVHIEFCAFIPLLVFSVTSASFQGHIGVKQFESEKQKVVYGNVLGIIYMAGFIQHRVVTEDVLAGTEIPGGMKEAEREGAHI